MREAKEFQTLKSEIGRRRTESGEPESLRRHALQVVGCGCIATGTLALFYVGLAFLPAE